jgi:hypothetical protein
MPAARKGVTPRKEKLEIWGDFEITSQIEHREGTGIVTAPPLGENLPAQSHPLTEIALEKPPSKVVIELVWGRIDDIAASSIGRPWSPTLL